MKGDAEYRQSIGLLFTMAKCQTRFTERVRETADESADEEEHTERDAKVRKEQKGRDGLDPR
jgi:hypothetical protein